ncbi:MAG TPA: FAD-dependent oxidoreductase [Anaeromyxobacteraceae bacterium]|nr:FAD-dependent oxidoreductase [Anaeromyxobacteraceae bacterium]
MDSFVIIGAGLSGLTLASELVARGRAVTVLERDAAVGGLARSFRYGERFFDVGPHRFHTDDPLLRAWIADALSGEAREIRRSSAVHAFGRLHDWPLRPRVLASLPPPILARAALDLLRRPPPSGESFEAEMKARYGATLYATFFEPYTRRFTGMDPARLHRDWGRAGVDRAVIDRRVRASGLGDLLRGMLFPAPIDTTFLYPERGIGRLADRLADRIVAGGGRILLGAAVDGVEVSGDRVLAVSSGARRIPVDAIVWTASLTTAARLIGVPDRGLEFRSTLLFNVALRRPPLLERQWIYFGDEPAFVRISFPGAFSPAATPHGTGALCVERTCAEGDPAWREPERLVPGIVDALVRDRVIRLAADVEEVHVERVADTYPVYTLSYLRDRSDCLAALGRYRNLLLAGRAGRFWYNNMDHSIAQALSVSAALAAGCAPHAIEVGSLDFWSRQGSKEPGGR